MARVGPTVNTHDRPGFEYYGYQPVHNTGTGGGR